MEELISLFCHQTLDSSKLTLLHKTFKAARFAIADRIVLNCTNTGLLAANTREKQEAQSTGTKYNGQKACVLSLEDVEKRRRLAENKKKEKKANSQARKEKQDDRLFLLVSKVLMRLGPDLIYRPNPVTPRPFPKNKKQNDSIFQNAFTNLLQITPDIFEETIIGDLRSKTFVRDKRKGVSRKKNTAGLVHDDGELVEKEEKEKVLEVRVNTRVRIICNTRKM